MPGQERCFCVPKPRSVLVSEYVPNVPLRYYLSYISVTLLKTSGFPSLGPEDPLILASPFVSALVFNNEASDARDHCANERSEP